MTRPIASLALGGAQFGLDYGISNRRGRVPFAEVEAILAKAADAGIAFVDTAPAYGDSEEVLGAILAGDPKWRIITKTVDLSSLPLGAAAARLEEGLERSLLRLKRREVDTLLFHRPHDLAREDGAEIWEKAAGLKRRGLVRRLGLSIYAEADLDLPGRRRWDVVQAPTSIVDQRLISSGAFRRLASAGVEVQVRSIFLQGLLLSPESRPAGLVSAHAASLARFRDLADRLGLTPLELCLAHVRRLPEVAICLVGISSAGELEQILAARLPELPDTAVLAVDAPDLVDPRRWPPR